MAGWDTNRPVLHRLPVAGYQDNPVAEWLTAWADQELSSIRDTLETFTDRLDPAIAPVDGLDYLAHLVGMSGPYWDTTWTPAVKRAHIGAAFRWWRERGRLSVLREVLDTHGFPYQLWQDGDLRLPVTLSRPFAQNRLRVYIRLPLQYSRTSGQWREAQRSARNWLPAGVRSGVCYQGFLVGFSVLGDPLFN
jgi:phage tail P2-like protein